MDLSREQVQVILKNGEAKGISKTAIMDSLIRKGHKPEGIDVTQWEQTKVDSQPEKPSDLRETLGDVKDTFLGIGEQLNEAGENIVETATDSDLTLGEKARGIGSQAFKGGSRAAGEVFIGGGKVLLEQEQEDALAQKAQEVGMSIAETEFVKKKIAQYEALPPDAKREINNALGFAEGLADIITLGTAKAVFTPVKKAAFEMIEAASKKVISSVDDVVKAGAKVVTKGKGLATKGSGLLPGAKKPTIAEIISPKINAAESRKIASQGRVTQPKESIIFGKKADIVTPEERIAKAETIIESKIKNVDELDQFQIANELEKINTATAKGLAPTFRSVKVKPKVTDNALKQWDELKVSQADQPEFLDFGGSKKFQERFERHLTDIKSRVKDADGKFREKDLNDVWDVRKQYDQSITDRVKQATSQSVPSLQLQHDMWIQNRSILNDVIFEMSQDLDDVARKSFEEMSLLYNARNNIIQKAKIDVKGKKGIVNERNILRFIIGAGGASLLLGS